MKKRTFKNEIDAVQKELNKTILELRSSLRSTKKVNIDRFHALGFLTDCVSLLKISKNLIK